MHDNIYNEHIMCYIPGIHEEPYIINDNTFQFAMSSVSH
jgi:hypothetical protein